MQRQSALDGQASWQGNPPGARHVRDAGFTLLESLVALVVAAILSIGLVRFMSSTHVVTGHADQKLALAALETAVMAALPPAADGAAFRLSGSRGEMDWEMTGVPIVEKSPRASAAGSLQATGTGDVSASPSTGSTPALESRPPVRAWQRYAITVTIRARGAVIDQFEAIRISSSGKTGENPSQ